MRTRFLSRDARYSAAIVLLALSYLLPALFQPARLVYPSWSEFSDLTLIHLPKALLLRQSLAEGYGWPLWSPYALSGQPLAANQLAMLFYPPALLLLLGPLGWSFTLFYALHLAWAGLGTYWLVRGLGREPKSALLAAAIFALCGKLAAHTAIGHASLIAAMAWLPWAFAFLHRTLAQHSAMYAMLAGVALAAQATTHTYALVYTAYGLVLYSVLYLFLAPQPRGERSQAVLRLVPRLSIIPVVAVLLGAAQLFPLVEMAPYSNRVLNLEEATLFSLSPLQTLAGLLFPTPNVGHEWIIYPGLATMVLAAAAWRARRQPPVLIFAILSLLGVLLALGRYTPLYRLAYEIAPGLRWMRTPARLWFFVTLGLAVLAAYGVEQWQSLWRDPARRTARLLLVGGMGFALLMSLGILLFLGQPGRGAWGLAVFGLLTGSLLLWAIRRRPTRHVIWLALLLILTDLLSFDSTLLHYVSQDQVTAPGREAAEWLAAQQGAFRVYSPSYSLPQPAAAQAGLEQIDGVEPVHMADYDRYMALAGGYGQAPFSVTIPPFPDGVSLDEAHRNAVPDLRLLGLLNGRYLVAAFPMELADLNPSRQTAGSYIYENTLALPRAFVVHQTQLVTHQKAWERLDALDPAHTALVEGGKPLDGPGEPTPAQIVEQTPNRLVVQTALDAPGLLVLSEIWYPGWQARDNGVEVPILRTNVILRGVYLEAGSHRVELDYDPTSLQLGLLISACTSLLLIAGLPLFAGLVTRKAWGRRT